MPDGFFISFIRQGGIIKKCMDANLVLKNVTFLKEIDLATMANV